MTQSYTFLTAQTGRGRQAIEEVMRRSYEADVESVPPQWALALVADGVPVAFILIDSERQMEFPSGDVRYAFICDVATREDRRREGHFRTIVREAFSRLRSAGIPWVVTHGRWQLYRQFGFEVFTHHCGVFATPEGIERKLGRKVPESAERRLIVEEMQAVHDDLLLVSDVQAAGLPEWRAALLAAAALARRRGKARILFEHPPAPSYGSRYPIHPSLETPFTVLARGCGAQVCVQGADPEGGSIPDADWIKVLDAAGVAAAVLPHLGPADQVPPGSVCLKTGAGVATIVGQDDTVLVSDRVKPGAIPVTWPSSALAQLVTGYQTAEALGTTYGPLPSAEAVALLGALFPRRWRLSRNESWTFAT